MSSLGQFFFLKAKVCFAVMKVIYFPEVETMGKRMNMEPGIIY